MRSSIFVTICWALAVQITSCQKVFINQVPAYTQLPACAEVPLSTIVRDMLSGCGGGQHTTSYGCFCFSSSAKFSSIISTDVASRCTSGPQGAVSDALDVFDRYCHLMSPLAPNTASATATGTGNTGGPTIAANSSGTWPLPTYTPVRTQSGPIPSVSAASLNRTGILALLAEIVCVGMLFHLLV